MLVTVLKGKDLSPDNTKTVRMISNTKLDRIVSSLLSKPIYSLAAIIAVGFLIRAYYVPHDLPISLDGITYFVYAVETSRIYQLPTGYILPNNGWPVFVSFFFSLFSFNDFLDYVLLQRYLAIIISVLTTIPIYLLCKKFVDKNFALIAVMIFAFEPRLILNSVGGLSESLFILLGTITLLLFFSNNIKSTYVAFAIAALFALVRYEGLLAIIPLSIMFFKKYRGEQKIPVKFAIAIAIFLLTLTPMAYLRIESTGQDGLISHFLGGAEHISRFVIQELPETDDPYPIEWQGNTAFYFLGRAVTNLIKFFGLALIPSFIFFMSVSIILIAKNQMMRLRDYRILTMILFAIFLLIPAIYAYGRGIQEVRYIFVLIPIFVVISSYAIKKISNKNLGLTFVCIVTFLLISSFVFLEMNKKDHKHEKESFLISMDIVNNTGIINADPIDGNYLKIARILQKWPNLNSEVVYKTDKISPATFHSLEEFIEKNESNGLTHLVTDGKNHGSEFIKNMHYDDSKYPYLIKIYDSSKEGYEYHVKIYKIDYTSFHTIHNAG